MTIKKLGLSAVVAAALATTTFAADANLTATATTYNSVYTATLSGSVASPENALNYATSVDLLEGNMITLTLDSGATFPGSAINWRLDDNLSATAAEGVSIDGAVLKLRVTAAGFTASADNVGSFVYDATTNDDNVSFSFNSAATADITMDIAVRDNVNDITLTDAGVADVAIFTKETNSLTATVDCGNNVVIDSTTKTAFTVNAPTTALTAECSYDMLVPTESDIDFDYSDVNVTTVITGGNFTDGNFTATNSAAGAGALVNTNPAAVSNAQTFNEAGHDMDTNDYNSTFTYNLNQGNILSSTTFPIVSTMTFVGGTEIDLVTSASDTKMTWELSTFSCTVKNMRSNATNGTNTHVKLYNDDSAIATVDVQVTASTGGTAVNLTSITTVAAGGSATLSSEDIKAAFLAQEGTVLANGYKAVVTYQDTDKTDGDASATQTNTTTGTFGVRVNHNNTTATGNYRGL